MSPGVGTPCTAAPPIPIAKVCFIAPSLTECRPFHCSPALGRAQLKVRFPVSETPPVKNQLVFRVAGVYTHFFAMLFSTWDSAVCETLRSRRTSDWSTADDLRQEHSRLFCMRPKFFTKPLCEKGLFAAPLPLKPHPPPAQSTQPPPSPPS